MEKTILRTAKRILADEIAQAKNMDFNEALEKVKNDELDMLIHIVDEIPQGFDSKIIATFKSTILMNIKNELSTKDSKDITFEDLSKQNVIMLNKHEILNYFNSVYKTYNITYIRHKCLNWQNNIYII